MHDLTKIHLWRAGENPFSDCSFYYCQAREGGSDKEVFTIKVALPERWPIPSASTDQNSKD
jgi:hypothetical protein